MKTCELSFSEALGMEWLLFWLADELYTRTTALVAKASQALDKLQKEFDKVSCSVFPRPNRDNGMNARKSNGSLWRR